MINTETALRESLDASFVNVKKNTDFNTEVDHLDLCCRSMFKCSAHKNNDFNYRHTNYWNIFHCECEYYFHMCLKRINNSLLSKEFEFIRLFNTTKCYAMEHPIIKCIKFEAFAAEPYPLFHRFENFKKRCLKYELNEIEPKRIQLFDLPFNYYNESSSFNGMYYILYDMKQQNKQQNHDTKNNNK